MKRSRKGFLITLLVMVFTLSFSANKLNSVKNAKDAAVIYSKTKKHTVITTVNEISDYADIGGWWLYNEIFINASRVYEIYSEELAEQGWYDSNYVILVGDELIDNFRVGDRVKITYIDVDLIPAEKKNGVYLTDATSASIILNITKVK